MNGATAGNSSIDPTAQIAGNTSMKQSPAVDTQPVIREAANIKKSEDILLKIVERDSAQCIAACKVNSHKENPFCKK